MHMSLCPDKPMLAGVLESFAPYPCSSLATRHDNGNLIYLTRQPFNTPHPAIRAESEVAKNGGFRDTTQGYLVLWVNYTFCTWGQCAGVYPLLRSKNTKCQSALTFVGAYASWHSFPIAENGHGARRLLTLISFRAKTHHGLFLSAVRQMPLSVQDSVCSHRKYRR